jgi:hypothetical protein|tara:strand:- start:186 stop:620 length:435 start_codon:yes stop_codon:yes gene_type:complete
MKLKKISDIKYLFLILFFLLIILKFFNTPYNLYSILNWNYNDRMEQEYGYCKNESWGFYNLITKKFNLQNQDIKIINDEGHVTLENLFNLKKKYSFDTNDTKFLILLNFQSKNNEDIFQSKYSFLKKYKIKYRYNNCFLLELND